MYPLENLYFFFPEASHVTKLTLMLIFRYVMYSVHVLAKGAARACGSAGASLAAASTLNMLPGPSGIYQDTTILRTCLRANRLDVSSLSYSNAQIRRVLRPCNTDSMHVGGMLTKTTRVHRSVGTPSASKY